MPQLILNGVRIDDTFAEAFGMVATAIVITAPSARWAEQAAVTMTGFATSVIALRLRGGNRHDHPGNRVAGRPPRGQGPAVRDLAGGIAEAAAEPRRPMRLTCPGTACYAGIASGAKLKLGSTLRYFGDGWRSRSGSAAGATGASRSWRASSLRGEHRQHHRSGGRRQSPADGLDQTRSARRRRDRRQGDDRGQRRDPSLSRRHRPIGLQGRFALSRLIASTNDAFCPTLKGLQQSALDPDIGSVFEIVIDGLTSDAVRQAMQVGLKAAAALGPDAGPVRISAGNYGGKLGRFHYHLKELIG